MNKKYEYLDIRSEKVTDVIVKKYYNNKTKYLNFELGQNSMIANIEMDNEETNFKYEIISTEPVKHELKKSYKYTAQQLEYNNKNLIQGDSLLYYESIFNKENEDIYIIFGDYNVKGCSYGKCDDIISILKEENILNIIDSNGEYGNFYNYGERLQEVIKLIKLKSLNKKVNFIGYKKGCIDLQLILQKINEQEIAINSVDYIYPIGINDDIVVNYKSIVFKRKDLKFLEEIYELKNSLDIPITVLTSFENVRYFECLKFHVSVVNNKSIPNISKYLLNKKQIKNKIVVYDGNSEHIIFKKYKYITMEGEELQNKDIKNITINMKKSKFLNIELPKDNQRKTIKCFLKNGELIYQFYPDEKVKINCKNIEFIKKEKVLVCGNILKKAINTSKVKTYFPKTEEYRNKYNIKVRGKLTYSYRETNSSLPLSGLIVISPGYAANREDERAYIASNYKKLDTISQNIAIIAIEDNNFIAGSYLLGAKGEETLYKEYKELIDKVLQSKSIPEEKLLFFGISKGGTIAYKLNQMFNKSKLISVVPQKSTNHYFNQRSFLMWGVKRYLSKEYSLIDTIEDTFLNRECSFYFSVNDYVSNLNIIREIKRGKGASLISSQLTHGSVFGEHEKRIFLDIKEKLRLQKEKQLKIKFIKLDISKETFFFEAKMDREYDSYSEILGYVTFINSQGVETENLRIGFLRDTNTKISILTTVKKELINISYLKIQDINKMKIRVFDNNDIYIHEEELTMNIK